jgi:outer membrane protein TolC
VRAHRFLFLSMLLTILCWAQFPTPAPGPPVRRILPGGDFAANSPAGSTSGSIPSGETTAGELPLTLADAVDRGLRYNLGAITGGLGERRAAASRLAELSNLLPNLTGRIVESSQQINLKAFGFGEFPGIPAIVGPFQVLDVRAVLRQAIVDMSAVSNWRGSRETERSAGMTNRDLRDSVVVAVVNLYLQGLTGRARIQSANAQIATAQAAYQQAVNMKTAGTVAGIDVLRAQVQLQTEQQRGIASRNDFEREKLDLARAIGLPPGQQFSLTTDVPYSPAPAISLEEALRKSLETRADYQSALLAQRAAEWTKRAATSERLPTLYFNGDYGTIGPSVVDNHGTYTAAVGLQFPIFDGGRIRSNIEQADVTLVQRRTEVADLRGRIDYEVRTSFLNLNSARDQVEVAQSSRKLAAEQLVQARDRFAAGVVNNLEVIQAQQAVAVAEESFLTSLYFFNLSKASLGRAIGSAQNIPADFLGVPKP